MSVRAAQEHWEKQGDRKWFFILFRWFSHHESQSRGITRLRWTACWTWNCQPVRLNYMFTSLFPAMCWSSAVKCFIHLALKCTFYTYICVCEKLNRSAFINSAPANLVAQASCYMESFMLFALNGSVLFPCMEEEKCLVKSPPEKPESMNTAFSSRLKHIYVIYYLWLVTPTSFLTVNV